MTTKQAAKFLNISPYYLRNLRQGLHTCEGPRYTMVRRIGTQRGGLVCHYAMEDLVIWCSTHRWRKVA